MAIVLILFRNAAGSIRETVEKIVVAWMCLRCGKSGCRINEIAGIEDRQNTKSVL